MILALFVLIDRTTCQLTNNSVIASSGTHFFVFLLFFLNGLRRNSKLTVENKKIKEKDVCQT